MEISNNFDHYVFIIYYLLNVVRVTFVPSSKLCYAGMGNDPAVTNKEIRTGSSGSRQHHPRRKKTIMLPCLHFGISTQGTIAKN